MFYAVILLVRLRIAVHVVQGTKALYYQARRRIVQALSKACKTSRHKSLGTLELQKPG
jgi:hypothetical protein